MICDVPIQPGKRTAHSSSHRFTARLPVAFLPALAIALTWQLPGWVLMWATAFAFYIAFKWLTWWDADGVRRSAPLWRSTAYLFAWPGMDAQSFLTRNCTQGPTPRDWIWPALNILFGVALIWLAVPRLIHDGPLAAGWCGMIGIGLTLHFGVFGVLSAVWRTLGVDAPRQFQFPIASPSLDAFWSRRWNRAFRDLSRTYVLLPLMRRCGPTAGVMTIFGASGLVHELVISLPARAGWGLPTLYFVAQGVGILTASSSLGRCARLNHGVIGWIWMALFVVGPLYWLFHPPFVYNVILPLLRAIGAA